MASGLDQLDQDGAQGIGWQFVRSYYEAQTKHPRELYRFYAVENSSLSYGCEGESTKDPAVSGQKSIEAFWQDDQRTIADAEIKNVDCQLGPSGSILIQVVGFARTGGGSRKFCQTFCLQNDPLVPQTWAISNDILRLLATEEPAEAASAPVLSTTPVATTEVEPTAAEEQVVQEEQAVPAAEAAPVAVAVAPEAASVPEEAVAPEAPEVSEAPAPGKPAEPEPAAPEVKAEVAPAPAPAPEPEAPLAPRSWAKMVEKAPAKLVAPKADKPKPVARTVAQPAAAAAADAGKPAFPAARADRCPQPKDGCSLYVRNVPADCTKEELVKTFKVAGKIRVDEKFGPCVNIHNMKNPPKNPSLPLLRYAFVEFDEPAALQKCLSPELRDSFSVAGDAGAYQQLNVEERVPRLKADGGVAAGVDGRGRGRGGRGRGGRGRGEGRGGRGGRTV